MTTLSTQARALTAGSWQLDPAHSLVAFAVRHLMISRVRGSFESFDGLIRVARDPLASVVEASIDVGSINTGQPDRDAHLRSAEFLDAERHPVMSFRSTRLRALGQQHLLAGELTCRGITRPVDLTVDFHGVRDTGESGTRAGFTASGEIDRRDFGIDMSMPLEGGGAVIGNTIEIDLEIQAFLSAPAA